jgi:hypothetical protein
LWTKSVVQCERDIHKELECKRLTDKDGRAAKGGVEWFKDTPTLAIPTIMKYVNRYRYNLTGNYSLKFDWSSNRD